MHSRRTAILVVVICALSTSAAAFEVFDPVNWVEHHLLNVWHETIGVVLDQQLARIERMATRLSAFTDLTRYVAPDAPLWRTRRIDDALAASDAFMDALNSGDRTGAGYAGVARERVPADAALARLAVVNAEAASALRSALATIDIAASVIVGGTDQTGRVRGNRRSEVNTIAALERDVADGNLDQSATAVLDKVSAAGLVRTRQQETRVELLTALTEQLLVDAKRDRDTETAALNMQLGRLTRGRAVATTVVAGSADAFRSWRQP